MTEREALELDSLIDRLIDLRQRLGKDIDIIDNSEFRIRVERMILLPMKGENDE